MVELTKCLNLIADHVTSKEWSQLTGNMKDVIHTHLWSWSAEYKHPSLRKCDDNVMAIDAGGSVVNT